MLNSLDVTADIMSIIIASRTKMRTVQAIDIVSDSDPFSQYHLAFHCIAAASFAQAKREQ